MAAALLASGCEKRCEGYLHPAEVLLAKRHLRVGELPRKSDFERSTICIHNPGEMPVSSVDRYEGRHLERDVAAGDTLRPSHFGEGPMSVTF